MHTEQSAIPSKLCHMCSVTVISVNRFVFHFSFAVCNAAMVLHCRLVHSCKSLLLAYCSDTDSSKQEVGKPSRNAAQPCAVYDDPYRGDEQRDGWAFRVGTWNVDSLTSRLGELVEALAERRMDVLCVQETRWRSDCRLFGAIGKGISCF